MSPLSRTDALARALLAAGLAGALAGCVVGPNYTGPPIVAPAAMSAASFHRADPTLSSEPPPARWWTALGDVELDRLEARALASAPDIAVAAARLRQSRAGLSQARADRLPNTGASALYVRTKGATNLFTGSAAAAAGASGQTGDAAVEQASDEALQFYDVGFDATWELDLFGGRARAVEGARAGAQAAEADLRDAEVSLTAEVAQAYLQLRAIQARSQLDEETAALEGRLLALTRMREAGGSATLLDVERLTNQLETTRTDLVPLRAQLAEQMDRLAVLDGDAPGTLDAELAPSAPIPLPPAVVPVGDPAALIRRRPDVRAAERRIDQQTALVGERTADLFPKVTLLGDVGFGSTDLGGLLTSSSFTYAVAPVLQWSPFAFGRTHAKIVAAQAGRDEAMAQYRGAVLTALGDAETALARYGRQREDLAGLLRVEASADREAHLTDLKVQGGTATSLEVLEAERQQFQAQTNVIQARADVTEDYVSLQKSLGLGWGG